MKRVAGFALVVALAACHLFEGPYTRIDDSYYFKCGDEKCRIDLEECSTGKPYRCIPAWSGASRDAGAD